jgi:hypothetical protein
MRNIHRVYFQKICEEWKWNLHRKRRRGKFSRGLRGKWCWNEKMRKSTSQKGFMRFHQLLKKTFSWILIREKWIIIFHLTGSWIFKKFKCWVDFRKKIKIMGNNKLCKEMARN